jgi:hypothetical protein
MKSGSPLLAFLARLGPALFLATICAGAAPAGAPLAVPAEWRRAPPGAAQAAAIEQGAARHGWAAMAGALRTAALETYRRGDLANAEAWASAARWAGLWATREDEEEARWRSAMEAEGWPGAPAPAARTAPAAPSATLLAERLSPELRGALLADAAWSAEFFSLEHPLDRRTEVLSLLARLHARDAAAFAAHSGLVIALALVHDVPPPPDWPHWQVRPEVLPRRLVPAEEVFDAYTGREAVAAAPRSALWSADRLDAAELRFLVDLALPEAERAWARYNLRTPLARLHETYSMIRYRQDRIEENAYVWPGSAYALADILREGGICVDQAYFATQAGKARGVPTLLFSGAGRDGRHAWFGYLGAGRKWVMDAGRHAEQNYVTGVAHDPQTWTEISDHELGFLSEGFRREPAAREARIHALFARWLREDGRGREAETAARAAVRLERRTLDAWDELLALRPEPGEAREAVAREAAGGLNAYPELQARFLGLAIESLRARGEAAEADRLGRELARRFAGKRGDLSTREMAGQLARTIETESVEEQARLYRNLLRRFGRGAGAGLWDEVVRPFVTSLAARGRWKEARAALREGREALQPGLGSQLEGEMSALEAELARGERAAGAAK